MEDSLWVIRLALCALYLRGLPRSVSPSWRRWRAVEGALRRHCCPGGSPAESLSRDGLWAEALCLQEPGLLERAEALLSSGQALTAACPGYPARWSLLGGSAPAALWRRGELPAGPYVAIVGSRHVSQEVLAFAAEVANTAVSLGFGVVSGGAIGCDSAAVAACPTRSFVLLPYGIALHNEDAPCLSVCAPDATFATGHAMERNHLIYAAAQHAIVVHARFREGGAWTGACQALRQRTTNLIVRSDPNSAASRALVALGATPLSSPAKLAEPFRHPSEQQRLFA